VMLRGEPRLGPMAALRALLVAFLLAAVTLWPSQPAADEPTGIAVSILPMKYFVERVGGERVRVMVVVGPGQSPATYEPTPRQIAELAQARAYFRIGVPFENAWMPRMAAVNASMCVVDLREDIRLRPLDSANNGRGTGNDPHVWTSPPLVKQMSARIRDTLADLMPQHAAEFAMNQKRFAADLEALDAEIRSTLADRKERRFLVFHPAWSYFADAYGLQEIPIEAGGKEPGPQTMARVIDYARREDIRVVFVQKQFSQNEAQAVAKAIGGEVVTLDPLAEDFLSNTRAAAAAFARALK